MKLVVSVALIWSMCVLSGCSKYWYQEGRSFRQTREDLAACQAEATRYSDVGRTHGLGRFEGQFVRQCMEQQGYELVSERDLPLRVRRESSPVFGVAGIAGTID